MNEIEAKNTVNRALKTVYQEITRQDKQIKRLKRYLDRIKAAIKGEKFETAGAMMLEICKIIEEYNGTDKD